MIHDKRALAKLNSGVCGWGVWVVGWGEAASYFVGWVGGWVGGP